MRDIIFMTITIGFLLFVVYDKLTTELDDTLTPEVTLTPEQLYKAHRIDVICFEGVTYLTMTKDNVVNGLSIKFNQRGLIVPCGPLKPLHQLGGKLL